MMEFDDDMMAELHAELGEETPTPEPEGEGSDPTPQPSGEGEPEKKSATAGIPTDPKPEDVPDDSPLVKAPTTWRPEAVAEWQNIPASVKEEILKREADMFAGIEQYKTGATLWGAVHKEVGNLLPVYQQQGFDIPKAIGSVVQLDYDLRTLSPEQAINKLVNTVSSEYGLDIFDFDEKQFVQGLQADLHRVSNELTQLKAAQAQDAEQRARSEIDAFLGNPEHKHANRVIDQMIPLLNQGKSLKDAYSEAVYLNPEVRKEIVAAEAAALAERQKAEAAAAQKRNTGKPPVQPRNAAGQFTAGSLEDILGARYDQLKG